MSHVAIAAALALEDVSAGERLAVFALASYANREHRAWPGTRVAAVRAGLSRSQYLAAREGLVGRGLIVVEAQGGGRGNSPVLALAFARTGPWFEGEINAPLFEAVLSRSGTRGSARLLLAALAALADDGLAVTGIATEELRTAAGMADSTYRRARVALLATGEATVDVAGGGRAITNCWRLRDPRQEGAGAAMALRPRVAPSPSARPLIATVRETASTERAVPAPGAVVGGKGPRFTGVSLANPAGIQTVSAVNRPGLSGVSAENPAHGRTVSATTPPNTPPETPPLYARAGREPQNPRTCPPSPPEGGSHARSVRIVEDYLTDRGRKRQRTVVVQIDAVREELRPPSEIDIRDWNRTRDELRRLVGEPTFEIWLAPLKLVAIDARRCLLLAAPAATGAWVTNRFARVFARTGGAAGRDLRIANERELRLLDAIAALPSLLPDQISYDHKEAI